MVLGTPTSTGTGYLPGGPVAPTAPGAPTLFCFHHAGGAASAFTEWQAALGARVRVLPVQLPGREARVREPRFTDMDALIDDLDRHLDPHLGGPYYFYGHSMGAIVAYNLARRRAARGRSMPLRLLVGAYPPPHIRAPITAAIEMSDDDLARWLVDIGGMAELMLKYPEWALAATSLVRDDLRVCDSHREGGAAPLPCPIEAFTGVDDPLMRAAQAAEWSRHTTGGFRLHPMPGGHFFIRDSGPLFLRLLGESVRQGIGIGAA